MSTVLPESRRGGFLRFAAGFGLGVGVIPLAVALHVALGTGGTAGLLLFCALAAGALSVPPRSIDRVAGFLTGVVATVVAGIGSVVWYVATHDITFG